MRKIGVPLSREQADCMKQAQVAIGWVLKGECDATQPLPDRLADLVRKLNLRMEGWSVSKTAEYQSNAQECERMAGNLRPEEKSPRTAEEYLRRAEECECQATEAKDLEAKRMFKEAAGQWRLMASAAERHGLV
jgi:hypothetical protein